MRSILLWLLGVPIPIIILIALIQVGCEWGELTLVTYDCAFAEAPQVKPLGARQARS